MSSLGLISALKEASKEAAAAPPSPPLSAQTPPPLSAQTLPTPSEQTPSKINNLLAARQAASATPLPPPIRPTNILDDTRKESAEKALPPPEFIPLKTRHPKHESIDPEPKMKVDCPDNNDPRSTVKQANALKPEFAGARYEPYSEHYSGECTYINPDRDYATARALSIFGGLLALDHFYLRSPTTAFMKIFVNAITFGLWWIWDIDQFVNEKERVIHYGLTYLFDMQRGIARGTIIDGKPQFVSKKDFSAFILLGIFFGILGLDRMYLGDKFIFQGVVKFLSCFILIGFLWVIWDMIQLIFLPDTILKSGYYPIPLPFTLYQPWEGPDAGAIADLFQVTLTPAEKTTLAKKKADETPSFAAGLGQAALKASPIGPAVEEFKKKMGVAGGKSTPLPASVATSQSSPAASALGKVSALSAFMSKGKPRFSQEGGALPSEQVQTTSLASAALATIILIGGGITGYSALRT
jgi:hypothetical protein